MPAYFLDSSAFAKLFIRETESPQLVRAYEAADQNFVSSLAAFEVRCAIRRRQSEGDLTDANALKALNLLATEILIVNIIEVAAIPSGLIERIIDSHRLRALDAIQLASALSISSALTFVSADLRLVSAASLEGLKIAEPRHL